MTNFTFVTLTTAAPTGTWVVRASSQEEAWQQVQAYLLDRPHQQVVPLQTCPRADGHYAC